jgi:hypothetical protein
MKKEVQEIESNPNITFVRVKDGRWRIFLDDEDLGFSFQFPWDALQCALNGSISGRPISNLQTIRLLCSSSADEGKRAQIRETDERQRKLLESLKGIDGEGI